jgi:hypothetical protein
VSRSGNVFQILVGGAALLLLASVAYARRTGSGNQPNGNGRTPRCAVEQFGVHVPGQLDTFQLCGQPIHDTPYSGADGLGSLFSPLWSISLAFAFTGFYFRRRSRPDTHRLGLLHAVGNHASGDGPCPAGPVAGHGSVVSDQCWFLYRDLGGAGSITVRMTSMTGTITYPSPNRDQIVPGLVSWAKAGIIVKDGVRHGSQYAALIMTGRHGVRLPYDYKHDVAGSAGGVSERSPRWLRLTRSGGTTTGSGELFIDTFVGVPGRRRSDGGSGWHSSSSARPPRSFAHRWNAPAERGPAQRE